MSWNFRIFEGVRRRQDMTIYDHSDGSTLIFTFSQNGHKDKNGHIPESLGTPKYIEILENPKRGSVFAHGGRRFTTFEASTRLF